jgi:hypothetical protein
LPISFWHRATKIWTPCYNRKNGGSRSNASLVEKSNFQKITVQARVLFCWYDIYVQRSVASASTIFTIITRGSGFGWPRSQTNLQASLNICALYNNYTRISWIIFSKKFQKCQIFFFFVEKINTPKTKVGPTSGTRFQVQKT